MSSRPRHLLRLVFLTLAALTAVFAIRAAVVAWRWHDIAQRDEAIAGWMTPRYVALSWDVPPEVISGTLGLARDGSGRRVTLRELAAERGMSVEELAAELDAAIAAFRSDP